MERKETKRAAACGVTEEGLPRGRRKGCNEVGVQRGCNEDGVLFQIYEVIMSRTGDYTKTEKVMDLCES